jgi:hypothetical protein
MKAIAKRIWLPSAVALVLLSDGSHRGSSEWIVWSQ